MYVYTYIHFEQMGLEKCESSTSKRRFLMRSSKYCCRSLSLRIFFFSNASSTCGEGVIRGLGKVDSSGRF